MSPNKEPAIRRLERCNISSVSSIAATSMTEELPSDDSSSGANERSFLSDAVSTILANPSYRFKTRSSLPWGHKPHPVLGVSCLCYLLIVPFLLPCYPVAGGMFVLTTACSYSSDHLYTGLDSMAHMIDKIVAPATFVFALRTIYQTGGLNWAVTSNLAIICHILAMAAARQNNYGGFVLWHTLWHVVGVALMVTCCIVNDTVTECIIPGDKDMGLWYGL